MYWLHLINYIYIYIPLLKKIKGTLSFQLTLCYFDVMIMFLDTGEVHNLQSTCNFCIHLSNYAMLQSKLI